jgi:HSP20 family protein
MSIIRWSPQRDLVGAHDSMDRLLDQFFDRIPYRTDLATFAPPVDIEENAEEFVVRADLPGLDPKDVKVSVIADRLTIRGERQKSTSKQEGSFHRTERVHGAFERSFVLGSPVRADQVQAKYRDGVLEVRVPKAEEARRREVEIQVA